MQINYAQIENQRYHCEADQQVEDLLKLLQLTTDENEELQRQIAEKTTNEDLSINASG